MTTKISEANIQAETLDLIGGGPRITEVAVTNSSYVATGATTLDTSGGYLKLSGTGFVSGTQVLFDETAATAVAYISNSVLHVQAPALVTGAYFIYVVNPDGGTGLRTNGLTVV